MSRGVCDAHARKNARRFDRYMVMSGVVDILDCSCTAKARTTTPMAMVAITVVRSRWGPTFQGLNTPSRQELAGASSADLPFDAAAYFISIYTV